MTTQWNALLSTISQLEQDRQELTNLIEEVQTSFTRSDLIKGVAEGAIEMNPLLNLYKSRQAIDESLAKLYGDRAALWSAQPSAFVCEPARAAPAPALECTAPAPKLAGPDGSRHPSSPLETVPRMQEALSFIKLDGQKIGLGVRVYDQYVLTALHCIVDNNDQPYAGLEAFGSPLELAGTDADSDLAIFKIPQLDDSGYSLPMNARRLITPGQQVWLLTLQPETAADVLCICQPGLVLDFPETSHSAVVRYTEGTCQFAGAAVVHANGELAGIHTGFYDFSDIAPATARNNSSSGGSSMVTSLIDNHMSVVQSETVCDEAAESHNINTQSKTVLTGLCTTAKTIATELVCTGAMKCGFLELARRLRNAGM